MNRVKEGSATVGNVFTKERNASGKGSSLPFFVLLFYIFMEYGRPQTLLKFLKPLHLSGIAIAVLALLITLSGKVKLREKQTLLYLFLLVQMVVHGPIAVNNYWALMIFIDMVMNFVVFVSLIHFVDDREKYEKLIRIWLGIHVFLAIVGIVKHGKGIGGFLGDENDLCMTLNMIIPFSFVLALDATGRKRILYLGLTCLFLFTIMVTESRGGFVGLLATSIYCWFRTKRKLLTAMILGILTVFAVAMAPSPYWHEVRSITAEGTHKGTGEARLYTWKIGWQIFLENPIIGVGQGNFPWVFGKYEKEVTDSDAPFHGRSVAGRAAHSIYFTMLPELGLVGTFTILGMIFFCFKDINVVKRRWVPRKSAKADDVSAAGLRNALKTPGYGSASTQPYFIALALEGGLISYLVSSSFISTLYYPNLWILMGFIISLRRIAAAGPLPAGSVAGDKDRG
jgi:O-antigen ligase